jgi:GNAT superfamily N-acetyltransferase
MSIQIQIRHAGEADARRISYLVQGTIEHAISQHYDQKAMRVWRVYYLPAYVKEKMRSGKMFIALAGGKAVGTICLSGDRISGMYVSRGWLNKGIGSLMLEHVIKVARREKIKSIQLSSIPPAVGFYLRKGFRITKVHDKFYNGVAFRQTEMKLTLSRRVKLKPKR